MLLDFHVPTRSLNLQVLVIEGLKIGFRRRRLHSYLPKFKPAATKVHMILRRYVVFTWMRDNRESM